MTVYDEGKVAFSLGDRLASGGQGVVWRLRGNVEFLVKVYHTKPTAREAAKQRALRLKSDVLSKFAALPVSLAYDHYTSSTHVGTFIPLVSGHEVFELYGTRSRIERFPNANFKFLVRAAYNLAVAFEQLHDQGIIVGDVNEQNIMVMSDATVRLIDCDSFQIRDGSTLYTSDVGTPLWTAPELHGKNLTGLERTTNHDLFGLAQLIFLLLFTGRHPFAGVPRSQRHLQPEEAIQQHAFAFAPVEMNSPLGPPPGSPRLEVLPQELRDAFLQAFLKDSIRPNGRPSATRWRLLMENLSKELATCAHQSSHLYWKGASACPWCQVVRDVGVDLFPSRVGSAVPITADANADDHYIRRIAGLRPHSFAVTTPPVASDLHAAPLPVQPSGFWSAIYRFFSPKGWKKSWLGGAIGKARTTVQLCEAQLSDWRTEQQQIIGNYQREFTNLAANLTKIVHVLSDSKQLRAECLQTVKDERRHEAMKVYLQRFYIRKHKIPQIGPVRMATVLSFGVETANDISPASLLRAGLPTNAFTELIYWRSEIESRFRFDPAQALTPAQNNEVEKRFQERRRKLREEAAAIEVKLNAFTHTAQQKLRILESQVRQLARQRDQAKTDIVAIENELNRP